MYSIVLMMAMSTGAEAPALCGGRCHGCHGCTAACHGCHSRCHARCSGCNACHGCHGGLLRRRCHGCHGCHGCCGVVACHCTGAAPAAPAKEMPKKEGKSEASLPTPATLVVSLPAEAKLSIDDIQTRSASAQRVFATPALEAGKEYTYTLTAEIVREGQKVTASKQVVVRAGEETRVSIEFPVATVAAK